MEINEVFKKYPENEPGYNGINYLAIVEVNGEACFSHTFFNSDAEFEPIFGKVLAFCEMNPKLILNELKVVEIC
jgi:hypothetical protein